MSRKLIPGRFELAPRGQFELTAYNGVTCSKRNSDSTCMIAAFRAAKTALSLGSYTFSIKALFYHWDMTLNGKSFDILCCRPTTIMLDGDLNVLELCI